MADKEHKSRSFPSVFGGREGRVREERTGKDVGWGHGRTDREAKRNADKDRQKRGN